MRPLLTVVLGASLMLAAGAVNVMSEVSCFRYDQWLGK